LGLIHKNEQNTTQLINLLNTLGININSKEFKPQDDREKDVTNEIMLRIKQGTYVTTYEAKGLELEPSKFVCKECTFSFFTKDGKNLLV